MRSRPAAAIPLSAVTEARQRIAPHLLRTPATFDEALNLWFKWENRQVTGSFKPRGALNKVLALAERELARGLVACSAGNHGQGLAMAGRARGTAVTIYASAGASPLKIEKMRALGAEVILIEGGYAEAEAAALRSAAASGRAFISPYNDRQVMAGAGTVALELLEQVPMRTVLVPVGGGGLLGGVGSVLKQMNPGIRIIAVQGETSAYLHAEFKGRTMQSVVERPSLADGLAGAPEPGSKTIPIMHEVTDDFLLVTEEEIAAAVAYAYRCHGEVIEGAAAVGLAAVLAGKLGKLGTKGAGKVAGKGAGVVVLVTGGNIDRARHEQLVAV